MNEAGRREPTRVDPSFGGLLVVDKPAGWTSHDVVARCRKVFGLRKVGHAGTLDPDATGVLLVGLGTVTRLLRFLSGLPKSYQAEVVLGVATSTLDASGDVTGRWDMDAVTLNDARAAAKAFTGTIAQIPPMVSAVHVGGRRLHELAREGIEVEREPRTVTVTRFHLEGPLATGSDETGPLSGRVFAVTVDCSPGTYIRTLAADLGAALGGGAHLRNLRRTAIGPYTLADAVPLDQLSRADVRPPIDALPGMAAIAVSDSLAAAVGHGKVLAPDQLGIDGPGPWAILGLGQRLLAVYEACPDGRVKPAVVLAAPERAPGAAPDWAPAAAPDWAPGAAPDRAPGSGSSGPVEEPIAGTGSASVVAAVADRAAAEGDAPVEGSNAGSGSGSVGSAGADASLNESNAGSGSGSLVAASADRAGPDGDGPVEESLGRPGPASR